MSYFLIDLAKPRLILLQHLPHLRDNTLLIPYRLHLDPIQINKVKTKLQLENGICPSHLYDPIS